MTTLDPALIALLDAFANSQTALRLPKLPFGSSNPLIGTSLDQAFGKFLVRTGTVPAGSANPVAAVAGLLTTDTILAVNQVVQNANSLPLIGRAATCTTAAQLVLHYSADPGASGTISVLVKTA